VTHTAADPDTGELTRPCPCGAEQIRLEDHDEHLWVWDCPDCGLTSEGGQL
jgi:predicted RNA-binding Zn-ribbon protein involved in translation (DUF1610 family)